MVVAATQINAMGRNTAISTITHRNAPPESDEVSPGSSTRKKSATTSSQSTEKIRARTSIEVTRSPLDLALSPIGSFGL